MMARCCPVDARRAHPRRTAATGLSHASARERRGSAPDTSATNCIGSRLRPRVPSAAWHWTTTDREWRSPPCRGRSTSRCPRSAPGSGATASRRRRGRAGCIVGTRGRTSISCGSSGTSSREASRRERPRSGSGPAGRRTGAGSSLDALIASAIRLDSDGIRAVLDRAEERFGVEATLRDVALPSMREIGARWKVGACSIEQEHLATHVVRTWCGRLVALAPPPRRSDPVVLTCGPKDLHTIGLEAFGVILTRRGWSCRVLGALHPTDALLAAVRELEASAAVVTAQRGVTRRAAIESIAAVDAVSGTHAFYAGGAFAAPSARRGVPGTYLGTDIVAAADVLESTLQALDGRPAGRPATLPPRPAPDPRTLPSFARFVHGFCASVRTRMGGAVRDQGGDDGAEDRNDQDDGHRDSCVLLAACGGDTDGSTPAGNTGGEATSPMPAEETGMTITEIVAEEDGFSTLLAAVEAADLGETLSSEGPFTVFAPTNEGVRRVAEGDVERAARAEEPGTAGRDPTYHVLQVRCRPPTSPRARSRPRTARRSRSRSTTASSRSSMPPGTRPPSRRRTSRPPTA